MVTSKAAWALAWATTAALAVLHLVALADTHRPSTLARVLLAAVPAVSGACRVGVAAAAASLGPVRWPAPMDRHVVNNRTLKATLKITLYIAYCSCLSKHISQNHSQNEHVPREKRPRNTILKTKLLQIHNASIKITPKLNMCLAIICNWLYCL